MTLLTLSKSIKAFWGTVTACVALKNQCGVINRQEVKRRRKGIFGKQLESVINSENFSF